MGVRRLLLIGAIAALVAPVLAAGPATAAGPVEVLSARTPTSRLFDNGNGTFTLRQEISSLERLGTVGWTSIYSAPKLQQYGYWNTGGTADGRATAGYNGFDEQTTIVRSFFQFDTFRLRGVQVLSAEFTVFGAYSAACDFRNVSLRSTTAVGPSTSWLNQPTTLAYQYRPENGYCAGGRWTTFNVTNEVAANAYSGRPTATFGLSSHDEQDKYAWRRYGTTNTGQIPVLTVMFEQPETR